jgi:hypothetical protein
MTAKKAAKNPARDERVSLTARVTQKDYERLVLLRARTDMTALDILEAALREYLDRHHA